MSGLGWAATITEEIERAVEAVAEVGKAERRHPSGRQLDGEGHAVQPAHDLGHDREVAAGRGELRADAPRAIDEDGDGRMTPELTGIRIG